MHLKEALHQFIAPPRRRRGLSVIELMFTMIVSVSFVAGALMLGTFAYKTQRGQALVKRLDLVSSSAYDSVITQGGAQTNATDMATQLTNSGGFPSHFVDGENIKTPYGDNLQVKGNSDDKIIITLSSLPEYACFKVGQYAITNKNQLTAFKIGTTAFNNGSTPKLKKMRATDLTTPCGVSGTSRPAIELTYK